MYSCLSLSKKMSLIWSPSWKFFNLFFQRLAYFDSINLVLSFECSSKAMECVDGALTTLYNFNESSLIQLSLSQLAFLKWVFFSSRQSLCIVQIFILMKDFSYSQNISHNSGILFCYVVRSNLIEALLQDKIFCNLDC